MTAAVRLGNLADIPALVEMRRTWTFEDYSGQAEIRDDYDQAMTALLRRGFSDGSLKVFVAESDGELVSHMYLRLVDKVPRPVPGQPFIGYLTNVYTRPAYRGQGIGGRILAEIQAWAPERGIELVVVWPSDASIEFWQRHGFRRPSDLLVWDASSEGLDR